ncbi:hypothetical protein FA15DRAFT_384823 [Coprinopsis marcescibilis]|uniref:Uncharacterized protein n=1 Tax=Coprinopsis marcescibilis TaxID=230819 RepID=A0A5C3KAX2_COPMA|nr:hypothetical protein FA15DRAFT_384823 [Coprinopsis marcescibilis]
MSNTVKDHGPLARRSNSSSRSCRCPLWMLYLYNLATTCHRYRTHVPQNMLTVYKRGCVRRFFFFRLNPYALLLTPPGSWFFCTPGAVN